MLLNCGFGEDSSESLGLQGDPTVHHEGDHPWDFFGGNDAKAETPVLWPPHVKSWLIGKDSDAGRVWGQEEKGTTEDQMAGWHHQLNGLESVWIPGVDDGQGALACCSSWGRKESDKLSDWTEINYSRIWLIRCYRTIERSPTCKLKFDYIISMLLSNFMILCFNIYCAYTIGFDKG